MKPAETNPARQPAGRGRGQFFLHHSSFIIFHYLVILAAGLWCAQLGAASDPYASEFEESSPRASFNERERIQQVARERQELYRKRVSIPDAVGQDVQTASAANHVSRQTEVAARTKSLAALPGNRPANLLLAGLVFLAGVLAIRILAPEISNSINLRLNPWAQSPSTASDLSAKVRAEDQAISEFLLAFRTGPSAPPGTDPFGVDSATESDPLHEFFAQAPNLLGTLRKLLQEIGRAPSETSRHKMLTDLYRELRTLKGAAGLSELLPVWQMASALEGLLKQLTDRVVNVTSSTLRTVAGGVDLLEELCQPGLKADLLTNPPLRLLAVDDDLISRKAVAYALKKALNQPDLAENGEAALALATKQAYDVIFLDVQMPGMDGFELCSRIHETVPNRTTPVVFVTCQSDFDARAKSILSGGSDLMGKPFLTFEITVKALTLALRGRLQGRAQSDSNYNVLNRSQPLPPLAAPMPNAEPPTSSGELSPNDLAHAFLTRASAHLDPLRDLIQELFQTTDEGARMEMLAELYLHLNSLSPKVDSASGHPALRLSAALEGLLKKLLENPKHCTSSTLLTIATAVDLLNELCRTEVRADLAVNPPIRLLVVDDDPVARRAIAGTLQMAFEKPESVASGAAALASAAERRFDVIFLDVQMPGMNGFTTCAKIRETVPNRTTPVVFVTGHSDFKVRAQSTLSGGDDLIGKPFLMAEITVKALTFALRGRLPKIEPEQNVEENSYAAAPC